MIPDNRSLRSDSGAGQRIRTARRILTTRGASAVSCRHLAMTHLLAG
jgi:hypothetical protein